MNAKALKSIFSILFIVEALTEEEKEKLAKIKKKMKRKVSFFYVITIKILGPVDSVDTNLDLSLIFLYQARTKRMEEAKIKKMREEKKKAKVWNTLKWCIIFIRSTSLTSLFLTLFKNFLMGAA